jgi:hypothetical protein
MAFRKVFRRGWRARGAAVKRATSRGFLRRFRGVSQIYVAYVTQPGWLGDHRGMLPVIGSAKSRGNLRQKAVSGGSRLADRGEQGAGFQNLSYDGISEGFQARLSGSIRRGEAGDIARGLRRFRGFSQIYVAFVAQPVWLGDHRGMLPVIRSAKCRKICVKKQSAEAAASPIAEHRGQDSRICPMMAFRKVSGEDGALEAPR